MCISEWSSQIAGEILDNPDEDWIDNPTQKVIQLDDDTWNILHKWMPFVRRVFMTGGEPTMKKHQESIVSCINYLQNDCTGDEFDDLDYFNPINLYNEIETNGTQYINDELFDKLDQINCSVKLANSGMSKEKRIVPRSLERITSHKGYWFKFVVSKEEDLDEIENDFIKPFNIDPKRVLMMPGLDHQDNFHERTEWCLSMARKYGYIGLTRLHISAWNQTTGV